MLLAYRRGLLKPDYPNGLQSRLREKLMLDILDMELTSDLLNKRSDVLNVLYANHLDPKRLTDAVDLMQDQVTEACKLKEYDINYSSRKRNELNSDKYNLAKAFTALKERGIIKSFQQHVNNVLKKINK